MLITINTKYAQDTKFENMPATSLEMPTHVASGKSRPSVYFNIISFKTLRDVKAKTLPGIEPIADVPKPLKIPGTPSLLNICLNTLIPRI